LGIILDKSNLGNTCTVSPEFGAFLAIVCIVFVIIIAEADCIPVGLIGTQTISASPPITGVCIITNSPTILLPLNEWSDGK
jgi:hypothetical protein